MRQLIIVTFTAILCLACDPYHNARIGTVSFSADTVYFDTVFSSLGSATGEFRAINRNDTPLLLERIYLGGGSASPFRLNIDGSPVIDKHDVILASGDSIFIFVDVIIDPSGEDSPVAVTDSVVFVSGNVVRRVILEAWGQDIRLLENTVTGSDVWSEGKPYVVYGTLTVDTAAVLTLKEGTRVYFHNDAQMRVAGTLITEGSFSNPVLFASDRTAPEYGDVPGQWKGIVFQDCSSGNILIGTEIRNADIAVNIASGVNGIPDMKIMNSRLVHNAVSSLVAHGGEIECVNTLFAHSGFSTVSLSGAGSFDFTFCTMSNRWEYSYRSDPVLFIGNNEGVIPEVTILNTVITGNLDHEMAVEATPEEIIGKIYADSSLIKTDTLRNSWWKHKAFINIQTRFDPRFIEENNYDFRPDTLSPLIDRAGKTEALIFPYDMRNMIRPTGVGPDIGAYERQPGEKKDKAAGSRK